MKRNKEQMNCKSGFADPDRIKEQREIDKPINGKLNFWDFRCPQYDQRSSNFINAGTHYGKCINQPVGHAGNPKQRVDVMPFGRPTTMRVDDEG